MNPAPGTAGAAPRWEVGSDFHLLLEAAGAQPPAPWPEAAPLLGSGRDALRVLLAHGQRVRGWRRLWVPSFLCAEVGAAARATGIAVQVYPGAPFGAVPPPRARAGAGDAVLRVSYFGLGEAAPAPALGTGAELVEDHTHDPWASAAYASRADFCLASLRKTLPLPDGGVLWSPAGHPLPQAPEASAEHLALARQRLSAMALKALYLAGGAVEKAAFRRLAVDAEARLGQGAPSGISEAGRALLGSLPVARWRALRREQHRALRLQLAGVPGLRVPAAREDADCSPVGAVLLFDGAARRERVRAALIAADIYPAILWPMDGVPGAGPAERALSHRLLVLPCDVRYGPESLARVAARVRAAAQEAPAPAPGAAECAAP